MGWGPGGLLWSNEHRLLTGPAFGSLDAFLRERPSGAPWAFWLGPQQTHRVFGGDCWKCAGRPAGADDEWVRWGSPEWLPDVPRVRADVHAHSLCIECFDKSVGDAIGTLRRAAQYERTSTRSRLEPSQTAQWPPAPCAARSVCGSFRSRQSWS